MPYLFSSGTLHDVMFESEISELDLTCDGISGADTDEHETSESSDFSSESDYDPSVTTDDENFIDDSSDFCSAANSEVSYDPDDSGGSDDLDGSDGSDGSDDSDNLDDISFPQSAIAKLHSKLECRIARTA
jgi:hypothetical protein